MLYFTRKHRRSNSKVIYWGFIVKKKLLTIILVFVFILGLSACDIRDFIPDTTQSGTDGFGKDQTVSKYDVYFNVVNLEDEVDSQKDLKTVLKEIRQTVVEVCISSNDVIISAGSGVVIGFSETEDNQTDDDGYVQGKSFIVTCHHVIESAGSQDRVLITTVEGDNLIASLVGSDPDSDICILSVDALLPCARFIGDSDTLDVGEDVVAIGNPLGTLGGTVTKGILSATSRNITIGGSQMNVLQTDASINYGNSGGGLFTTSGYLIGIVNAKYLSAYNSSVEGIAFAIPSNTVKDVSKDLIENGFIPGKYVIGCTVANFYTTKWASQGYVYISSLDTEGSFYKSGLREGDILISFTFNNRETNEESTYEITTANEFVKHINGLDLQVGDRLVFTIRSGSLLRVIEVVLEQYVYGVY